MKTVLFLSLIFLFSCGSMKAPRIKEKLIQLRVSSFSNSVQLNLANSSVLIEKNDAIKILKQEVKSKGKNDLRNEKERVLHLLLNEGEQPLIFDHYAAFISVLDKLIHKGQVIIKDENGNDIKEVKIRKEYMLYGSIRESVVLPSGKELIRLKNRIKE